MPKAAVGVVVLYVVRALLCGVVAIQGFQESLVAAVIALGLLIALAFFMSGRALGRRMVLVVDLLLLLLGFAYGALGVSRGGAFGEVAVAIALGLVVTSGLVLRFVTRPSIVAWNAPRT